MKNFFQLVINFVTHPQLLFALILLGIFGTTAISSFSWFMAAESIILSLLSFVLFMASGAVALGCLLFLAFCFLLASGK